MTTSNTAFSAALIAALEDLISALSHTESEKVDDEEYSLRIAAASEKLDLFLLTAAKESGATLPTVAIAASVAGIALDTYVHCACLKQEDAVLALVAEAAYGKIRIGLVEAAEGSSAEVVKNAMADRHARLRGSAGIAPVEPEDFEMPSTLVMNSPGGES
jgi:hypothetical protein